MSYEYNPKSNIVFGNVDLSDYNAYAVYCNIFDRPERDISVVSVPGRNGDLIFDNGRYKNVDRTYQIHVVGVENVHNLIRDLISTIGYQRLEDEYDPNVYMMARLKTKPNVRKFVGNAVLLTVTFDRMPQRWDKNELLGTSEETKSMVYNDTSVARLWAEYAFIYNDKNENLKTILKMHGANPEGWIWIYVFIRETRAVETQSGEIYVSEFFEAPYGYKWNPNKRTFLMSMNFGARDRFDIVIDSENQVVYDDVTKENMNDCINNFNKFPEIKPGNNHIYVIGEPHTYTSSSEISSYDIEARKWII